MHVFDTCKTSSYWSFYRSSYKHSTFPGMFDLIKCGFMQTICYKRVTIKILNFREKIQSSPNESSVRKNCKCVKLSDDLPKTQF